MNIVFFSLNILNRISKAAGFKSLRKICREINQVASKCQTDLLDKTYKKVLKQKN